MIEYPHFPQCNCEMHPAVEAPEIPDSALQNPLLFLPPPIEFTDEMDLIANRYRSHDIDWHYYRAFQAACFLKPKSAQQHDERRRKYLALKAAAEVQGFTVPESLTDLFTTDAFVDRLHHNRVWPDLSDEIVRLPSSPEFIIFKFLIEGQACGIWHLLLGPDGSHRVVTVTESLGCPSAYPFGRVPTTFQIDQCMNSVNELLYHYFLESRQHDIGYMKSLQEYFAEQGTK